MEKNKFSIPVIICSGEKGRAVIFGFVDQLPNPDDKVRIRNARMVLRWGIECGGLFGFSQQGPFGDTRLSRTVDQTTCVVRQALTVSIEAAEKIVEWKDWK